MAETVLRQTGEVMTPDTVTMLATCSDQANKSKVMGAKGLSEMDPLTAFREKFMTILQEEPNGQA